MNTPTGCCVSICPRSYRSITLATGTLPESSNGLILAKEITGLSDSARGILQVIFRTSNLNGPLIDAHWYDASGFDPLAKRLRKELLLFNGDTIFQVTNNNIIELLEILKKEHKCPFEYKIIDPYTFSIIPIVSPLNWIGNLNLRSLWEIAKKSY